MQVSEREAGVSARRQQELVRRQTVRRTHRALTQPHQTRRKKRVNRGDDEDDRRDWEPLRDWDTNSIVVWSASTRSLVILQQHEVGALSTYDRCWHMFCYVPKQKANLRLASISLRGPES